MRERDIEKYLVRCVRSHGGEAYKFESPGRRGVPDRLVLPGDSRVIPVEVKAPGKKVRPDQVREHNRLAMLGLDVRVVATKDEVDAFIDEVYL